MLTQTGHPTAAPPFAPLRCYEIDEDVDGNGVDDREDLDDEDLNGVDDRDDYDYDEQQRLLEEDDQRLLDDDRY